MSSPYPFARPEIPALTSLRFFAALWVVLFHIREIGLWRGGPAPYIATVALGYLGVSFFFVLSGFILVYVYAGREIPRPRFWRTRFARIYPAYLFSLLITLPMMGFMLPFLRQMHVPLALGFAAYPLLLEAWMPRIIFFWNPVAWSLSVEAFFYLLFPFVIRQLEKASVQGIRLWIAGSWVASVAITSAYVLFRPDGVAHTSSLDNTLFWLAVIKFNPLVRLPEFLLGMGAGALFLRTRPAPRTWPILAGGALVALAIALQRWIPYPSMHSGLLAPAFALLVFGFATQPSWTHLFQAKPLVLLGEASYSLYLLHVMPIGILTFGLHLGTSPHALAITLLYLATIILISIGVLLGIENPMRRLLRPHTRIKPLAAIPT